MERFSLQRTTRSLIGTVLCTSVYSFATDIYTPSNSELYIPLVLVGQSAYVNVVITVDSIVGSDTEYSGDPYDVYNGSVLTIPSVNDSGIIYNNIDITVKKVMQVGGSILGGAVQTNTLSLTEPVSVMTLAGSAGLAGTTDGIGTSARFYFPYGVTTDGTYLYVSDSSNDTIRKISIASRSVATLAGNAGNAGTLDGTGSLAMFNTPAGLATDGTNLYVADYSNSTIRKVVIATGVTTTLAGSAGNPGFSNGTGVLAKFNGPLGITTDGANLYVTDSGNEIIRKISLADGVVTTLAGTAGAKGSSDGIGAQARFNDPIGITTDGSYLYVTDTDNHTVRKINLATGSVSTLAGSVGISGFLDGTGVNARFNHPLGLTTDGANLYVADNANFTVRKVVLATAAVTTLAGSVGNAGATDGTGTNARFHSPAWITTEGANLYVTDDTNNTVRMIGNFALATGSTAPAAPTGITGVIGNNTDTLSWSNVSGATCYNVYYSTYSGFSTSNANKLSCVTSPATIIGLIAGTNYYYVITSVNSYGESPPSTEYYFTAQGSAGTTGVYYYANWSCGSSAQCAGVMGGYTGSEGPLCTINDCNAWGTYYIPGSYSCTLTPTYTLLSSAASASNGVCFQQGVDF